MASMMPTLLLVLCSLFVFQQTYAAYNPGSAGGSPVGVVHGTFGDNLPSQQEVVYLLKHNGIQRIRIFGPDQGLFQALQGSQIEVVLGVPNQDLHQIAFDQNAANSWVQNNVKNNQPNVRFRYIVVGNGVSPLDRDNAQYVHFLFPALKNIQQAISQAGLANSIRVTTAVDHHELVTETKQPSQATFRPEIRPFVDQLLSFLQNNNAPLLVNLHPFYSYAYSRPEIPGELNQNLQGGADRRLDYALFRSSITVVQDGQAQYTNAFDAMLDSVHNALDKAGKSSVEVVVGETGWPTAGGNGASQENARIFNNNLIRHVNLNGTPKRPQKCVETYIFTLFDENKKTDEVQKNWGIFSPNKQPKYDIDFSGQQQNRS